MVGSNIKYRGNFVHNDGLNYGVDAAIAEIKDIKIRPLENILKFDARDKRTEQKFWSIKAIKLSGIIQNWQEFHDHFTQDKEVYKIGAATKFTVGQLSTIRADFNYNGCGFTPTNQLVVTGSNGLFCDRGDSGSIVWNADGKVVGLLYAGLGTGEGIITPIYAVLDYFNVELDI